MAERGICSRREADEYISRGQVRVDGQIVDTLGTKVFADARITLEAEAMRKQKSLVTILLNKPIGYVSSQPEPGCARYLPLRDKRINGSEYDGRAAVSSNG